MIVYWLAEAVIFAVGFFAVYVPMMAIGRRMRGGDAWPFVRRARLVAAEAALAEAERQCDWARAMWQSVEETSQVLSRAVEDSGAKQRALATDNANLHTTVANLTEACSHYTTAIGTLQRMLAQQQVTFMLAPYWASKPAQEATRAAE